MTFMSTQMIETDTQRIPASHARVRDEEVAARVDGIDHALVECVESCLVAHPAWMRAQADDAERTRREQLEIRTARHPTGEHGRQTAVLTNPGGESFGAEVAHDHPEL